jgi:hypothetical protein
MGFNDYLSQVLNEEASTMTAPEMADKIRDAIKEVFPDSLVKSEFEPKAIYRNIYVAFTLGKDKSEYTNGYAENDPMLHRFSITGPTDELPADGTLPPKVTVEASQGGHIYITPEEKYLAYGRLKLGWKKKTGTPEQIVAHMKNYFVKAKELIKQNMDKMHKDHVDLVKTKVA